MAGKSELPRDGDIEVAQPGLRFLELAVYIMGGLLVVMFLGLIAGIVWKVTHKTPPAAPVARELHLGLPAGEEVRSTTIDGDRLVITTASEVIVVDLKQNAVLTRIGLAAK